MSLEVDRLRALAHPLRLQMLSLLTGAELSAAGVARELDITQANASYHLRQLASAGLVEVVREERVRGGVAKVYRHPWEGPAAGGSTAGSERLYAEALASELVRRFALRAKGKAVSTDAELWVEPTVWAAVIDQVEGASKQLHARARPPRTEGAVRVNMTAALFEMRPDDPREPA